MKKNTINTAQYFSLLFFLLAFMCLTDIVHRQGQIVETSIMFSFIHLLTGIGLLVITRLSTKVSIYFIRSFGLIYLLISLIGFQIFQATAIEINSEWSHVFYLNLMNYIHFALGVKLSFSGTILNNRRCKIAI